MGHPKLDYYKLVFTPMLLCRIINFLTNKPISLYYSYACKIVLTDKSSPALLIPTHVGRFWSWIGTYLPNRHTRKYAVSLILCLYLCNAYVPTVATYLCTCDSNYYYSWHYTNNIISSKQCILQQRKKNNMKAAAARSYQYQHIIAAAQQRISSSQQPTILFGNKC